MIYHIDADKSCVEEIIDKFPSVAVDERFSSLSVNIDIPDEMVDEVVEYCDINGLNPEVV